MAWLIERTNILGKIIYADVPVTLGMPGMLQAMAYVLLLSPHIGFLNKAIEPLGIGQFNVYSQGVMIFIEGCAASCRQPSSCWCRCCAR